MRVKTLSMAILAVVISTAAIAQSVVTDVLMGKLVKPQNGVWAWYDLKDANSPQTYLMRMAIVGEERVGMKDAYWLELEIVPAVGYRSIFKMLVTGPASDPKNLHKVLQREGRSDVEELPLPKETGDSPPAAEPEKKLLGSEDISLKDGSLLNTEHYELGNGDEKVEVWLNEDVRPMGIVRMISGAGELKLRNHGIGGQDARSVINDPLPAGVGEKLEDMKVEVGVGDDGQAQPEQPAPPSPAAPPVDPKTPKPAAKAKK